MINDPSSVKMDEGRRIFLKSKSCYFNNASFVGQAYAGMPPKNK